MALEVGVDTYKSVVDIQSWLTARGYALVVTEGAVLRAMDFLESLPWIAPASEATTPLRWGDAPPNGVILALYEAVRLELTSPGSLNPETSQNIKALSVGPVSLTFGQGEGKEGMPSIYRHLRGLLASSNIIRLALM
jgi:hypothetical protein